MPFQRLPNWIQLGAFLLALNAGMVNVLGLFTVLHQSVSHMTGNASLLAMNLVNWQPNHLLYLSLVLICYVIGSFYSGLILGNGNVALGRHYGFPLSLVAIFLFLTWLLIPYFPRYGLLWACVAMGVQNAMVSHYKGAIIRTTHLSGVLTDIGLALGYKARGLHVERRRIFLHLLIFFGFLVGGVLASMLYPYLQLQTFLIPTALSLIMSVAYWIYYFRSPSNLNSD
ncbi:YoaK family protein [Acinetobacter haemolyticus]|uniref:YoaK family protein n=1 Tax=Acinetobacter haemolyticus TaxID=29430 RepID=UPI002A6A88C4|nr:YoaK family protein [Acinetobacter haemolyticus]WPO66117.1 YoaK family protein [Acinetobacter haemolyticus]